MKRRDAFEEKGKVILIIHYPKLILRPIKNVCSN